MINTSLPNVSPNLKDSRVFHIPLSGGAYVEIEHRKRSGPALTIGQLGAAASVDVTVPQIIDLIDALAVVVTA